MARRKLIANRDESIVVVDQGGIVLRITPYTLSLSEDEQAARALREAAEDMDVQCLQVQFP